MLPTLVFAMLAVKAIYSRKWAKTALKVATLAAFTLGLVLTLAPTTTSALPTPVLQLSGHEHGHHEPPPPGSHATLAPATMTLPTPILQPSDVAHDPNQPPVSHGTSMTFEQLVSRQCPSNDSERNCLPPKNSGGCHGTERNCPGGSDSGGGGSGSATSSQGATIRSLDQPIRLERGVQKAAKLRPRQ